jgi:hypothetical protein
MKELLIIEQTRKIYQVFNKRLFGSSLPDVKIWADLKKRGTVRFNDTTMDLVIGPGAAALDEQSYMSEVLHEMVHIENRSRGIADVLHDYHNKKFRERALQVGLVVVKTKALGWGTTVLKVPSDGHSFVTPPEDAARHRCEVFIDASKKVAKFSEATGELRDAVDAVSRQRDGFYTLKYQCKCPPPYNSIRSGRRPHGPHPLNVRCLNCNSKFVCVEKMKEEDD